MKRNTKTKKTIKEKKILVQELATYKKYQQLFIKLVPNKWVVIKKKDVLGAFDTFEQALQEGYKIHGTAEPMLIKQVLQVEIPIMIYNNSLDFVKLPLPTINGQVVTFPKDQNSISVSLVS